MVTKRFMRFSRKKIKTVNENSLDVSSFQLMNVPVTAISGIEERTSDHPTPPRLVVDPNFLIFCFKNHRDKLYIA